MAQGAWRIAAEHRTQHREGGDLREIAEGVMGGFILIFLGFCIAFLWL